MMKKRNSRSEPLQKALAPLDQINPLPPSLSPESVSALLRQQKAPQPAKHRTLSLRHVAMAAAVLAVVIGAVALWKGLPYLEVVNSQTGEAAPLTEVLQDYSKVEAYFQGLKTNLSNGTFYGPPGEMMAQTPMETMQGDAPKASSSANRNDGASSAPESNETPAFGKTNTQIAEVDEADILKNDGACLYFVPSGGENIQIISPRPESTMKVLSTISVPLESGKSLSVAELYVRGNRLIAVCNLAETDRRGIHTGDSYNSRLMMPVFNGDTRILIYDIGDRSAPRLLRTFTQDGGMLSSRMIGDVLYLVTQYTVDLTGNGALTDYIPTTTDGEEAPKKLDANEIRLLPEAKTPNYLVVSVLDTLDETKEPARKAVLGSGDQVYCNMDALYVACAAYENDTAFTSIISFPFTQDGLGESVSGRVRGRVLNQFSLDSFDGTLRLATTETVNGTSSSRITILDKSLKTLSSLANIAPGEEIYAVRFLGAKGYVVTFRQTDPLFVIDLSDTAAPKILGKLKIPGFSSYLHPVGENLLLGIGQDADASGVTRGVKLSLFDVSNPAKPKEIDSLILPGGTCTDAPSAYKSILFLPEQNAVALPVRQEMFDKPFHAYYQDNRYCVFSLQSNRIELVHTLRNYTQEEQRADSYGSDSAILRGTYIGDTLYTLSNGRICAFSLANGQRLGQLDF